MIEDKPVNNASFSNIYRYVDIYFEGAVNILN